MKKKLAAMFLAALMLSSVLAGCGGKGGDSTPSPDSGTAPSDGDQTQTAPAPETSSYPEKDLTALVYWAAGGTTDTCVRSVINAIPEGMLDKNIIVSNVAGGSGLVGATDRKSVV